jgi:hypothetical protein
LSVPPSPLTGKPSSEDCPASYRVPLLRREQPGPFGDGFAFMLGNGSEDVNGEFVRVGHIDCLKLDATLHEVCNEGDVTRQTVKFSYDQDRVRYNRAQGYYPQRPSAPLGPAQTHPDGL